MKYLGIICFIFGFIGLIINKINEQNEPELSGRPSIIDGRGLCYLLILVGLIFILN